MKWRVQYQIEAEAHYQIEAEAHYQIEAEAHWIKSSGLKLDIKCGSEKSIDLTHAIVMNWNIESQPIRSQKKCFEHLR